MNPELRRYFWQELTVARLFAMPLFLILIFYIVHKLEAKSSSFATTVAETIFVLLVLFWGCRRSAASVATEVREATWDTQRMSTMGPWSMTWGKLLGSTAFVWYGGVICLAAIAVFQANKETLQAILFDVAVLAGAGMLGQSVSLAIVLAWLRKWRPTRKLPVTLGQFLGVCVGLIFLKIYFDWFDTEAGRMPSDPPVDWYGRIIPGTPFMIGSLLAFLGWALIAAYRLMGAELQVKSTPWGWTAFTIFLIAYGNGFSVLSLSGAHPVISRLWLAFAISIIACYLMLFIDPKSVVQFRALVAALRKSDVAHSIGLCPAWLRSVVLAGVLGMLASFSLLFGKSGSLQLPYAFVLSEFIPDLREGITFGLSILAFLLRDISLILLLNIRPSRKRADMAAIFYLIFAYGILPGTLRALELPGVAALFLPDVTGFVSLVSAMFQGTVMAGILIYFWCRAEQKFFEGLARD